jgi:hypothetical protein
VNRTVCLFVCRLALPCLPPQSASSLAQPRETLVITPDHLPEKAITLPWASRKTPRSHTRTRTYKQGGGEGMGTSRRPLLTVEIALSFSPPLAPPCLLACFPATCDYATLPCLSCLVLSSQASRQASRPRIPQFAEPEIETGGFASASPPYIHVYLRTV